MSAPGGGGRWKGPRERRKEEEEEEARRKVSLLSADSIPSEPVEPVVDPLSPSPSHPSPPPSGSPSPDKKGSGEEEHCAKDGGGQVTDGMEVMSLNDGTGGEVFCGVHGEDADMDSPTPQRGGRKGGGAESPSPERGHFEEGDIDGPTPGRELGRGHAPMSVSPQRGPAFARGIRASDNPEHGGGFGDDDEDAMAISPPRVRKHFLPLSTL